MRDPVWTALVGCIAISAIARLLRGRNRDECAPARWEAFLSWALVLVLCYAIVRVTGALSLEVARLEPFSGAPQLLLGIGWVVAVIVVPIYFFRQWAFDEFP